MPTPTPYSTHLLRHVRATIGQNIRHARTKQKMPLEKLSRLTGISADLLDRYELGKNEIGLEDMLRVGCVLGVDLATDLPTTPHCHPERAFSRAQARRKC